MLCFLSTPRTIRSFQRSFPGESSLPNALFITSKASSKFSEDFISKYAYHTGDFYYYDNPLFSAWGLEIAFSYLQYDSLAYDEAKKYCIDSFVLSESNTYMFDEYYEASFELPENIKKEDAKSILEKYLKVYSADDDKDIWFSKIKDLCEPLGFTPNVKEFKKTPELFKGHVGDVSTVIRLAVTSRKNTPDLCSIMQLLGENKVNERINKVISAL